MSTPSEDTVWTLARRIERSQARVVQEFPAVFERAVAGGKGGCLVRATGVAVFAGPKSPATKVSAFGVDALVPSELDELEAFLVERGAKPCIDVSSALPKEAFALLADRGYHRIDVGDMFVRQAPLDDHAPPKGDTTVRRVEEKDVEEWALAGAEGFAEEPAQLQDEINVLKTFFSVPSAVTFLAEVDGAIAGASVLVVDGDVGHFIATSTRAAFRRRGVQLALLHARLLHASRAGVTLVRLTAEPGGSSHRNAVRMGFSAIYRRERWEKSLA